MATASWAPAGPIGVGETAKPLHVQGVHGRPDPGTFPWPLATCRRASSLMLGGSQL